MIYSLVFQLTCPVNQFLLDGHQVQRFLLCSFAIIGHMVSISVSLVLLQKSFQLFF